MEHHSNIVPWQLLQQRKRIRLRVVPVNEKGELRQDIYRDMFTENTRLVAICHVSNVLGTVNPVKEMIAEAHKHGVPVLVDGAQSAPHMKVDVQDIDADFYACSAHKMYGPTGVGVLYGKKRLLESMTPYQGGGEMIATCRLRKQRLPTSRSSLRQAHPTSWASRHLPKRSTTSTISASRTLRPGNAT